jgi:tetratricopeptide (TPR) repeat protein
MPIADELTALDTALEEGDLAHAAHHLAAAIAEGPDDEAVEAAIARYAEAAEDPLEHIVLDAGAYHGAVALYAHLIHGEDLDHALWLLIQAQSVVPDARYHAWIDAWTEDVSGLEPERVARGLKLYFERVAPEEESPARESLLSLGKRAAAAHPDDETLFFLTCVYTRRADQIDEAIRMGRARTAAHPSPMAFVALAGALREAGELEGAIEAFSSAHELDTENESLLLDIGDLHLELERPEAAREAYGRALESDPDHPWARPSALHCAALLGDEEATTALNQLAEAGNERAQSLLGIEPEPWLDFLPNRGDAIIQAAAQILDEAPEGAEVSSIALSALEAPSAVLSFGRALEFCGVGHEGVNVENLSEVDEREPIAEVELALWRYEETSPVVAVEPPPSPVVEALMQIATSGFDAERWWDAGAALGAPAAQVAAAMVHPPEIDEEDEAPWDTLFHLQVAAAFALASDDEGRELLEDIARGPIDWTVTAALGALAELAEREPDQADRLHDACRAWLSLPACPARYQHAVQPIALLLTLQDDLPEDLEGFLDAYWEENDGDDDEG